MYVVYIVSALYGTHPWLWYVVNVFMLYVFLFGYFDTFHYIILCIIYSSALFTHFVQVFLCRIANYFRLIHSVIITGASLSPDHSTNTSPSCHFGGFNNHNFLFHKCSQRVPFCIALITAAIGLLCIRLACVDKYGRDGRGCKHIDWT